MNQNPLFSKLRAVKTDMYSRVGHHGILIPSFKDIARDVGEMVMPVSGHFRIEARCPARYKGARVLADFPNLILNSGLTRLPQQGINSVGYIQLGTGTTPPVPTDTTLAAVSKVYSATATVTDSYVPGPPNYYQTIRAYRAGPGVATGTFSEVGIGWNSGANLFSRALIVDGGGSPTTITVLSDEYLEVYYTFRFYPMLTDITGTTTISGSSYDWVLRSRLVGVDNREASYLLTNGSWSSNVGNANIYQSTSTLGTITGSPSGSSSYANSSSVAYTAGNFYSDFSAVYGPATNVAGGVKCIDSCSSQSTVYGMQQSFTPVIPKTSTTVLTLTNRVTYARYP